MIELIQSAGLDWSVLVFPLFGIGMVLYATIRIRLGGSRRLDLVPPVLFGLIIWAVLLLELPADNLAPILTRWFDLNWGVYLGIGLAPLIALAAYFFELWLATKEIEWKRRQRSAKAVPAAFTVQIGGTSMSGVTPMSKGEAFALVERLSASTTIFVILSIWTMLGEELLYRGVVLNSLKGIDYKSTVLAWCISSTLYGLNHLPFGVPAFIGKVFAGLLFAGLAMLGQDSIVACLVAHFLLQLLVLRRFKKFS